LHNAKELFVLQARHRVEELIPPGWQYEQECFVYKALFSHAIYGTYEGFSKVVLDFILLQAVVFECLAVDTAAKAASMCVCENDLSSPNNSYDTTSSLPGLQQWWERRMSSVDDRLTDDLYLDILARRVTSTQCYVGGVMVVVVMMVMVVVVMSVRGVGSIPARGTR
jgi:hypothetical protein